MGTTAANKNRRIRQEALREQLAQGGHVQHVVEMANNIANLDKELEPAQIQRLKTASEIKLKLINKYIPDLKQEDIDHSGSIDSEKTHTHKVKFVSSK